MKKIVMLTTGGTIASTDTGKGLTPTESGAAILAMFPELKGICEIRSQEVMSIDSSNMQPEDWVKIATAIYREAGHCDGMVITHGTDTMAYTAAALTYMLPGLAIPVVLTGSQLPMDAPGTDARRNILDAFTAACDKRLCGVYIVFDGILIRGIHASKVRSTSFHAFESINAPAAGLFRDGCLNLNEAMIPTPPQAPLQLYTKLSDRVILVKLTPGMAPELLDSLAASGYRAVILEGYGVGGIPNQGRDMDAAVRRLRDKGILTLLTTQCTYEGANLDVYGVGVSAVGAGAISCGPMTTEAIYAKLLWILGETADSQMAAVRFIENTAGEWTDHTAG